MFTPKDPVVKISSSAPAIFIVAGDTLTREQQYRDLEKKIAQSDPDSPPWWRNLMGAEDIDNGTAGFVSLKRGKKKIPVSVIHDTTRIDFTLKPVVNSYFWANSLNIAGFVVDIFNKKIWTYRDQHVDIANQEVLLYTSIDKKRKKELFAKAKQMSLNKGNVYFTIGSPWVNYFSYDIPDIGRRESVGFFGLSTGVEYHYSDRHSVSLEANVIMNIGDPAPASASWSGWKEDFNRINIMAYDNYNMKSFSFGYGINVARNHWRYCTDFNEGDDMSDFPYGLESISRDTWTAGNVFNLYWRPTPVFKLGVVYQPTYLCFNTSPTWKYEHSISLDIKFNILLNKKNRSKNLLLR